MLKAVWVLVRQNVFALLCCCSLLVDGEVCSASACTWRLGGRGEGVGSETLGADLIGSLIFFSMCHLVYSDVRDIVVCSMLGFIGSWLMVGQLSGWSSHDSDESASQASEAGQILTFN